MINCACDLCGSEDYLAFPTIISRPNRVVICRVCSLIYTNPRWDEHEIKAIYETVFRDDPGAPLNARKPNAEKYRADQFHKAQTYVEADLLPQLAAFIEPAGKKWLDVRFRAGALPVKLAEMGAEIHAVDIFDANIEWLAKKLPEANLKRTDVHNLLDIGGNGFDAISMVISHVGAHVPSVTELFQTAFDKLKSGGILFVDEKDVAKITAQASLFSFQYPYGMAHYYHLTLPTTVALIKKAGFEILKADYNGRISAQKHFLIVARKPLDNQTIETNGNGFHAKNNHRQVYANLLRQYVTLRIKQKSRAVMKKFRGKKRK
jgi:2-polyprenyl-3-methyl-5-hydroxy-6-metoxy-1,4-benzoquinol methylase